MVVSTSTKKRLSNVIIESDSQLARRLILGNSKAPPWISIILDGTRVLAKDVKNLKFIYCNRSANKFTDRIVRKANQCASQTIVSWF